MSGLPAKGVNVGHVRCGMQLLTWVVRRHDRGDVPPTADEAEWALSRLGGLERSIGGCGSQLDVLTRGPRLPLESPVVGPLGHVQVDESVDLTAPYT